MTIQEKVASLPDNSGVYIMKDANGVIIYIGKAKKLKNRVSSYFNNSPKGAKVLAMVSKIADFDYLITNTEVEALLLENTLIKKHQPHYNILLKDDKAYPFLKIDLKEPFPKVVMTRRLKNDKAKYFGPFMQGVTIGDLMRIIGSVFPLRRCKLDLKKLPKNHRPCLNAHIGLCKAPCVGGISKEEYQIILESVISFLNGNDKEVRRTLTDKMLNAAEREDYEQALYLKESLEVLDRIVRKQVATLANDFNLDIFAIAQNGDVTVVSVLFVRGGILVGGDKFPILDDASFDDSTSLTTFLLQYYQLNKPLVSEIVVDTPLENVEELEQLLYAMKGGKVSLTFPKHGVRRQLADMARKNASEYLEKAGGELIRKEQRTEGAVYQLQMLLNLPRPPLRMECYDIAHISGTNTVSSMVVFEKGVKLAKDYRTFKIKTVTGVDDFASMLETLGRRFDRLLAADDSSFSKTPDLLVIDGGFGQLNKAIQAMKQRGLNIPIISLAKKEEIVCLPDNTEVVLPRDSFALFLLQRIRDEAHRFCNNYHGKLRTKQQTAMSLCEIEGIGKTRASRLMRHFKSVEAIKNADIDELMSVDGMNITAAKAVFDFFQKRG